MGVMGKTRMVLTLTSRGIHEALSFIVFSFLDLLDCILCFAYKVADFLIEAEWKPCYCTSAKEAITSSGKILVSEKGESKIVCLSSSKLELEEISDTLYARPSLLSEVSKSTVNELKRIKVEKTLVQSCGKFKKGTVRSTFTVNSTIVEMLQGKIGGQQSHPVPRWSDCDCKQCTSWTTCGKETLFVKAQGPKGKTKEDVLFIHGFISSSAFWTETLFPNFSDTAKSSYRFFAVDLLGFGRSPKPTDSLYTLREHLDMIERSVLEPYKVKSFHIVAHSLGCILALALAVKHPGSVKSLTLLAPPYYPVPKGVQPTQYVMRRVAPRRVWPPIAFGASLACWYEHITRTICLVLCKNHRLWEFLTKLVTRNRIRTFLLEGFFCHTHNAAWHTLHNIICGTGSKLDGYLDAVRERLKCDVSIFHGQNDELIPVECSYSVQKKVPRARVKVIEKKDHITIVVGRQKAFARELEEIWSRSSG
ncbi:probable lysophospholipase BODYGUARD 3 [Ricinus communis]|uniref:Valacyclovir hydrolase, putative n=1 Tax=Ricinus communis TaxID=3988 RepID=B9RYU6_RICCO|nr:probable lysophospholipase BODYGUARD 3 [Ricinus communis]EEF43448.1 valacyclovir hydrolase, putative [Ricinus communis]|eukprot:XP_002518915.1 probable lysophospholipase BODYGUARD 3 [Ricinus communis]